MVQTSERLVSTDAERYLLVYMIAVLGIVATLVIVFFIVFQKRKNKLLLDKIEKQREFEEALIESQTEIQEQTLKNVGQELHDNVGQLLSFASMQLNLVSSLVSDSIKEKVDDTKNVVKDAIEEVRALSKSLNNDVILNLGLHSSIQNEVDRLNKLEKIAAKLTIQGKTRSITNSKDEIILFRIIQEFISNTIKHSEAKNLEITLNYSNDFLKIIVQDDGVGFDMNNIEQGSGLINMKNRAVLINTRFNLETSPSNGVKLMLDYPLCEDI
jgi:signal transduction histidine kinase